MDNFKEFWYEILSPVLIIMVPILVIITIFISIPAIYSSCRKAEVYNKQNGTTWTCSDFFWASDQINSDSRTLKIK